MRTSKNMVFLLLAHPVCVAFLTTALACGSQPGGRGSSERRPVETLDGGASAGEDADANVAPADASTGASDGGERTIVPDAAAGDALSDAEVEPVIACVREAVPLHVVLAADAVIARYRACDDAHASGARFGAVMRRLFVPSGELSLLERVH